MTHVPIDELTFGIELEVIMPAASNGDVGRSALARRLVEAGLVCEHEAYNHRTRPYWKIVTDGSIGHTNAELVSPILRGDDGFEQIKKACRALDAHGCRVNRTCGMHVHVGVRDRFAQQIGFFKELVRTYAKYEPILDQLVAPSRRAQNSSWCQPVRYEPSVERARTIDDVMMHANPGGRYSKLNLQAYGVHGTVEFRQHQGTTNAQKIENWVRLCLRIVQHSAKNTEMVGSVDPAVVQRTRGPDRSIVGIDPPTITSRTNASYQRHIDRLTAYARRNDRTAVSGYRIPSGGNTYAQLVRRYRDRLLVILDRAPQQCDRNYNGLTCPGAGVCMQLRETGLRCSNFGGQSLTVVEAPATIPSTRPATDAAPTTLEGLLDLIGAVEAERAYFIERQLELNA